MQDLTPQFSETGKWREVNSSAFRIRYTVVTPAIWQELIDLGEYETPPWDELLLDAMDLDIELGPSLVLAATAVETRIANALDVLAANKVDTDLWTWINHRDDDYIKTPTVSEQLDHLLESLGARTLKDDLALWKAGVQLRQARNSFVHDGRAVLGRKTKTPVTREKARELVTKAGEIIDYIEALLPEDKRRPQLKNQVEVTTRHQSGSVHGKPTGPMSPRATKRSPTGKSASGLERG